MSKIKFISKHAGFTISRNTVIENRAINGVPTAVQVTPPPIRFKNFELEVDSEDTAQLAELRKHRLYGSYFEEKKEKPLPKAVKEAVGSESDEDLEPVGVEETVKDTSTVVAEDVQDANGDGQVTLEDVTTIQQAKDWLIENCGEDGREINSPEKIKAAVNAHNLNLPNAKFKY